MRCRLARPPAGPDGLGVDELTLLPPDGPVAINVIDYALDKAETQAVADLDQFLSLHRPDWAAVRWVSGWPHRPERHQVHGGQVRAAPVSRRGRPARAAAAESRGVWRRAWRLRRGAAWPA